MRADMALRTLAPATLLLAFAGLACDSPKDHGAAPAPSAAPSALASAAAPSVAASALPSAVPSGASAAPAPAASAPSALPVPCKTLLPDSALLRVAAGFSAEQGKAECPECGPQCNLVNKGRPFDGAMVTYVCNATLDKAHMDAMIAPLKKTLKKSEPVKGFGRGGIHGEKDNGTFYEVLAFDDDTSCAVTVDAMRGNKKSTLDIAQVALQELKKGMAVAPSRP